MQNETHLIYLGSTGFEFSGGKIGEVLNNICGIKEEDKQSGH